MLEFFTKLFDTADFPTRWHCGAWTPGHGWLHILSDLAIFGAYAAIPLSIAYFIRKRGELSYPKLYWLFAAFIFSCGFGHLIEATIFWQPWYRLSGLVKLCTAAISWATVFALIRVLPQALAMPTAMKVNDDLAREVSERKRAEEKIRQLNERLQNRVEELQALLDVLPVGIGIATDPECHDIRTNRAFGQMLRVAEGANASLSAEDGVAPNHFKVFVNGREQAPEELPIQVAARRDEAIHEIEEEIVFNDGQRLHLLGYAAPLHDANHAVRGAVGAFVDITARKRAEAEQQEVGQKLREAQKLESLGALAGGVAHDFNNLLTGVVGNASLARMEVPPTSPLVPYLVEIEESAMRAADLCKQMLAYAGKGRFVVQKLDVSTVIRDTANLLQSSISRNATLKMELAEGLPPVLADAAQMRQIIMNIVINASEAIGDEGGTIKITTGSQRADRAFLGGAVLAPELPAGNYVFIEVSDTGCGMSRETTERMFDPFFTTKFTGRGLGLAAVHGIVRGHRGAIKVDSAPSRGTALKLLLPAAEGTIPAEPSPPAKTPDWRGSGTVLVVDDEPSVRLAATRMLEAIGFSVLRASDGREGVETYRLNPQRICAVLLDLTMPRMDGEATLAELRKIRAGVRVLLMSGFNEQEALHRFFGKGLAGFVQKPFNVETLSAKLEVVLAAEPGA